jgi:hypothetical protein
MKTFKQIASLLTMLIITSFISLSYAQTDGKDTGLGVMLGEPTGISLKLWKNNNTAYSFGLAWSLEGNDAVYIHADHLWHSPLDTDTENFAFSYGLGARAIFSDNDTELGARLPLGLNFYPDGAPMDIFVEIAPTINLIPSTDGDVSGVLGARFYF